MKFKGFIAFALALFLSLSVFALALASAKIPASLSSGSSEVISLEKSHYDGLTVKKAFGQVLALSAGSDELESTRSIAANLAAFEDYGEAYFREKGVKASFWFGSLAEGEENAILKSTLDSGVPSACSHCYGLHALTLDWNRKPVLKSTEFIFNRTVSKNGFVHAPTSAEWIGQDIVFGVTFYDERSHAAWLALLPEGFGGSRA